MTKPVPVLSQVACTQYLLWALVVLRTVPSSASRMLTLPSIAPASSFACWLDLHQTFRMMLHSNPRTVGVDLAGPL